MTLPFFIVGGGVLDAPLSDVLPHNKRRGVTFLPPNKKVTKGVSLRRALHVTLPRAKDALLKNPPVAHLGSAEK